MHFYLLRSCNHSGTCKNLKCSRRIKSLKFSFKKQFRGGECRTLKPSPWPRPCIAILRNVRLTLKPPLRFEYQSVLSCSLRHGMLGIWLECMSGNTHVSPPLLMLQYTYTESYGIPKFGSIQYHPTGIEQTRHYFVIMLLILYRYSWSRNIPKRDSSSIS